MSDVSCRAFTYFLAAERAGYVDVEQLIDGLPHDRAWYEDTRNRVPWDDWAEICERFRAALKDDEVLRDTAWELVQESEIAGSLKRLGRAFVSPRDLYFMVSRWVIGSVYRVVQIRFEDVSPGVIEVEVTLPPSYRGSESWFLMFEGGLPHAPLSIGLSSAKLTRLELTARSAHWRLRLPKGRTIGARFRRWFGSMWEAPLLEELAIHQEQLDADLVELNQARAAVLKAQTDAEHSRATMDALMLGLPDWVVRINRDDVLVDVAAGAGSTTGVAGLRLGIGKSVSRVVSGLGDVGDELLAGIARARTGEVVVVRVRPQDPATRFEVRFIGVNDEVIAIVRDVSEQARLQVRVAQSDRLATLGTLAASVAHEVNNPLTFVRANIDMTVERLDGDVTAEVADEVREMLHEASDGARRVGQIIHELLAFARPESSEKRAYDLNDVLTSALHLASHELRHRATLTVDRRSAPLAMGDPDRIVQVLINLLVNAAQACRGPAADNTVTVTIDLTDAGEPSVRVQDTGVGISADAMRRIFEPFYSSKDSEGMGLGLAISRGIIEDQGGRIVVESELGEGTSMIVVLPAAAVTQPVPQATEPAEPVYGRILVLDDESLVLRAISRVLKSHDVVALSKPEQAVARLLQEPFDLVLCDLMMPASPGWAVHEQVCEVRPELTKRFVFLSGGSPSAEGASYLKEHGLQLLHKPFTPADLRAVVQRCLTGDGQAAAECAAEPATNK